MEPYLVTERLKSLSQATGLSLDLVTQRWRDLQSRTPYEREELSPRDWDGAWNLSPSESVGFFLSMESAGLVTSRWNVLCPTCGRIVRRYQGLGEVDDGEVHCAACEQAFEVDLRTNASVVFSQADDIFPDRNNPYEGDEESYSRHVRTRLFERSPEVEAFERAQLRGFKVFKPWEIGKIPLSAEAGATYRLSCLELGSSFYLHIRPAEAGTESFLLKMQKAKEDRERAMMGMGKPVVSVEVDLEETGFTLPEVKADAGRIEVWMTNNSKKTLAVSATLVDFESQNRLFTPANARLKPFFSAQDLLSHPGYFMSLKADQLPETFHVRVSGLTFLWVEATGLGRLAERLGEAQAHAQLRTLLAPLADTLVGYGGLLFRDLGAGAAAGYNSPEQALKAVGALLQLPKPPQLGLRLAVHAAPVLAVKGLKGVDFFGRSMAEGQALLQAGREGEVLTDAGLAESAGPALSALGLAWAPLDLPVDGYSRPLAARRGSRS